MRENGAKFGPRRSRRWAALAVSPKRGNRRPARDHRETSASHNPFAKPARIPPRNRAESPKTIPKTVWKTVKASNNRPSLHMVGAYATPFLCDWRRGAPARGGPPPPATFLLKAGGTGLRRDPTRPLRRPLVPRKLATRRRSADLAAELRGGSATKTGGVPQMCHKCGPNVAVL